MVFVAGPRQVGKTTLARALPGGHRGYLNWDIGEDRTRILAREFPSAKLWIFDEIHRYKGWRGLLKGLYDGRRQGQRILVTGSARLDLYRHGGDSLQGRYHLLRLHPLSSAELGLEKPRELESLLQLGGFPEPYFGGSEVEARRWSREYRSRLVREEVSSLEQVQDLGNLELLMMRLPDLVGSPLSINAVREDLKSATRRWRIGCASWSGCSRSSACRRSRDRASAPSRRSRSTITSTGASCRRIRSASKTSSLRIS
jgi:predicted AAA+ superfamily ATPase